MKVSVMSAAMGGTSKRIDSRPYGWMILAMVTSLGGCEVRRFPIEASLLGDAGPGRDGGGLGGDFNGNGPRPDGGLRDTRGGGGARADGGGNRMDACVASEEVCDLADNNCDGKIDEGFNLQADPANCGSCGTVCAIPRAFSVCTAGVCAVRECLPGHFDTDKDVANGCECARTNGGIELCDGQDNDCDGEIDEGFDLPSDVDNCGACNTVCQFANAAASCEMGACKMGACEAGRIDLNMKPMDGCEYSCLPSNGGIEVCDGMDNDCDGGIDVNTIDEGQACGPMINNVGQCRQGMQTCTSGKLICLGAIEAGPELCDNVDNNCDGATDEGFNKQSDIRYCGDCSPCALAQAVPKCTAGMCQVEVCSPGFVDLNTMSGDGCEYACTFRGVDTCNGADDDCDGMTDEGIDKMTDASNCGACGKVCGYANATGVCMASTCGLGPCDMNFHDIDNNAVNGCEYFCVATGAEADDGIDKMSDPGNCGSCGRVCQFSNAGASCGGGQCQIAACLPGFHDLNNNNNDGCEYQCTITNGGVEMCDGLDNDCDKQIDENVAQVGQNCFPTGITGCNEGAGTCAGICKFGKRACLGGALVCQGATEPGFETCDLIDNDCDGGTDEDFDKQSDPRFCGNCATACSFSHAVALCQTGACSLGPCQSGWVNLDGSAGNGCEYPCAPEGPEVCDGKDNDCDGMTDAADPGLLFPATNFCLQVGECGKGPGGSAQYPGMNTFPVCVSPAMGQTPDWICNYPATVDTTGPNQIAGQELRCDSLDNDCDNATDEQVATLGDDCFDSGIGQCQRTGQLTCIPGMPLAGTQCDYGNQMAPSAQHEICDGKDNDCDGSTDESWNNPTGLTQCSGADCLGVRDTLVYVNGGGSPYYMFQHEASRVDATGSVAGVETIRACGRTNAKPWTSVTYNQAKAACASAGMRLCRTNRLDTTCASPPALTTDEWGYACGYNRACGAGNPTFPYSCTYGATTCNGAENGAGATVASGSKAACVTNDLNTGGAVEQALDMSGNAAEWTEDCRGILSDGTNRRIFTLRGGAYDSENYNGLTSLRCDFTSVLVAEDFVHPTTGFRCCSSCAPGMADCGGVCVDLAVNGNCGGCGISCGGGTTCQNGRCR